MLDSITVGNLPPGADAYAGYVNGNWPTYPAVKTRFPGVPVLSIAVTPAADAECCDCESGDLTPGQVPAWVRRQLTRDVTRPVVYCSASIAGAVLRDLATAGIKRNEVRLWSAHYAGRHICGPGVCPYPQADGTQWRDNAPGANGSRVDESLLHDGFFGGDDMAISADDLKAIAKAVLDTDGLIQAPDYWAKANPGKDPHWSLHSCVQYLMARAHHTEVSADAAKAALADLPAGGADAGVIADAVLAKLGAGLAAEVVAELGKRLAGTA